MKNQDKVKYGEKVEACATKGYIQEVNSEDMSVNLESGRLEMWYSKMVKKRKMTKQKIQAMMLKSPVQKPGGAA